MNKEDLLFRNHLSFYTNQKMLSVYKNNEQFKDIYKILSSNHIQGAFEQLHTVINLPNGINISILPKRINITSEIINNAKEKPTIQPEKISFYELYISHHDFLDDEDIKDAFKEQEESAYGLDQSDTDLLKHLEEKSQICIVKKQKALDTYSYYYNSFYNNNTDNEKAKQFLNSGFIKKSQKNINLIYQDIIERDKVLPCCIDFIEQHYKNIYQKNNFSLLEHIFIFNSYHVYNNLITKDFFKQELKQTPFIKKIVQENKDNFFNKNLINIFEKDLLGIKTSNNNKKNIRRNKL